MLIELSVRDFAIVRAADLTFGAGFTALTGETGAGKSILVDAIDLALGARPGDEAVRAGAEKADITLRFDLAHAPAARRWLAENDFDDDGELLVRRVVTRNGRNKAYLNGAPATVGQVRDVADLLVDLHGQHESQSLFDPARHVPFLDTFLGLDGDVDGYAARFDAWRDAARKLERLHANRGETERKLDMLTFQAEEIAAAGLTPGEEEELLREKGILANAEKILGWAQGAVEGIDEADGAATGDVGGALLLIEKIVEVDPALAPLKETVAGALIALEEGANDLRAYASGIEADPDRLLAVDDRLDLIRGLKRKYGESVDAVIAFGQRAAEELATLRFDQGSVEKLEKEVAALGEAAAEAALRLDEKRNKGAKKFVKEVKADLADLSMGKAELAVAFTYDDDPHSPCVKDGRPVQLTPTGIGAGEMLFTANPGEPPRPLAKIASGGEISRVMLAVKSALAGSQPAPVMIFDEVDTGVGGVTGDRLGEKMKELAKKSQVFCVTHLAQVARSADTHLKVEKESDGDSTTVTVAALDRKGRVAELARMATGEKATGAALKWAEEALG
ncbi:MAG: DNA repair protein RecN [Nitrospinae bacterium]|nr:DNA repair protein RecN [Nitrospinota bacterium]